MVMGEVENTVLFSCEQGTACLLYTSYLIAHHHTYNNIDGIDYQILVEADFLVNMCEDELSEEALQNAYRNIFRTETGKKICRETVSYTHLDVYKRQDYGGPHGGTDEGKGNLRHRPEGWQCRNGRSDPPGG